MAATAGTAGYVRASLLTRTSDLSHTGEECVECLRVGGHLSQVTVTPQDVRVLGGNGRGGSVTKGGGPEVARVGHNRQKSIRLRNPGLRCELILTYLF